MTSRVARMDEETRPLLISHAVAALLGLTWIALVYLLPSPPPTISLLRPEEAAAVDVHFDDEEPPPPKQPKPEAAPVVETSPTNKAPTPAQTRKAKREEQAMADAFGGGSNDRQLVGDVTNALRGVNVNKGQSAEGTGKAVIAYGQGGTSVRTPGRGVDPSVTAAGAGIGRVNASGSVSRANISVAAPTIVKSADGGPSGRDMSKLGTFVRARQAQLQYCYRDVGLNANANLAGSVNVTVTLDAAGAVNDVRIANRTWSGGGVPEAEACILSRVRGWSFPPSSKGGAESYSFSFIFNK